MNKGKFGSGIAAAMMAAATMASGMGGFVANTNRRGGRFITREAKQLQVDRMDAAEAKRQRKNEKRLQSQKAQR